MKIRKNTLMLVYLYGYQNDYYTPFYDDFLGNYLLKYLRNTKICLVISARVPAKAVEEKFGPECRVLNLIGKPDSMNIWIRDWAPVNTGTGELSVLLKAKYKPRYHTKKESLNAEIYDYSGVQAARKIGQNVKYAKLVLDGCGFVHDGKGTGIVTNRVISDNETLSISEIENIFRYEFGINMLVFLPVEPGDETGHADGIARFAGGNKLITGDYPSIYKEGKDYCEKVRSILRESLPDYEIISLLNEIPEDAGNGTSVPSATGNHVNFLLCENILFLPDYGLETDDMAYETLKNNLDGIEVVRVKSKYLNRISRDGGVLNCITWYV